MKTTNQTYDLIVIGGGPSGMMAAGRAAELGARVLLLEKNRHLGEKLKITGGGRCNITNAEFNVRTFLENFPQSKEFLFSPFSKFSAKDTFTFFEEKGLPLVVEARKRAFPASQKAFDVFLTMEKYIRVHRVKVEKSARVSSLKKKDGKIVSVKLSDGKEYSARYFALATGGTAAPETGSTGDGFKMLSKLGHIIAKPNPNIVPLKTSAKWVHSLSGTTLSFMTIRFKQNGKTKIKKTGKILFTHFGVSGPLILNSSYEVRKLLKEGPVEASIDLFPDTEENDLDRRVQNLFEKNKNKKLKNMFSELLPKALAEEIVALPELGLSQRTINSITREERKKLVKKMKDLTFPITGTLGFDKAIIADGGVILEEVDLKNMTSKLYPNLYLLGDTLSINRPSGGFSLQMCWTTGFVAG
ncbi:MAG: aminoacetone oxidase family FAD-binding enzyme, partial [Candidatus Yonathbacteria bacterium]|nr:aminoacetone oxidase family FAD-binding enzyme [Candidatus Yonathbacteria bacterium]